MYLSEGMVMLTPMGGWVGVLWVEEGSKDA